MTHDPIIAVADFNCRPSQEEITSLLAESKEFDTTPCTEEQIQTAITKAEQWLDRIAGVINSTFSFHGNSGDFALVRYREGEDLGWTCNNSCPSPFNDIHPQGPTVYVYLKAGTHVRPIRPDYQIGLDFCSGSADKSGKPDGGYKVMLRVPEHRIFVALQFEA